MRMLPILLVAAGLWGADTSLSPKEFRSPPDAYRPIPFWAWTGDVHRSQIQRQLRLMRDQRLMSAMIYPRFGLEVPYFSEEFLGLIRYTVDQARALGMKIWLYDEYTWPSGTAGKRIPRETPQFRSAALCVFERYVAAADARHRVDLTLPPDVVRIMAVSSSGEKRTLEAAAGELHWAAPPGAWRVQVYWVYRADDYVDTLNPKAIRRFIDLTYEGYRKTVGDAFGSVIQGIFTDEPVMVHRTPAKFGEFDVKAFPWTDRMPEEFRAEHGYDLMDRLPELLTGGGVRRDLRATGTRLYSQAYSRQIGDWCRKHGLVFTGHILSEEPASLLVAAEGDYFANQRWMGMPSIDEIHNRPGFGRDYPKRKIPIWGTTDNAAPGEWVAPKMAQATAEAIGARRTLVEAYAYGPPSITLNEMRRVVNWEAVLGINSFLIAVFPSSLKGSTISTGWLPALFYQQPWYRYYRYYSDYVARTTYLLTRGERVSRTGVIYPSSSCWGNPNLRAELDAPMKELARLLLQSQQDFTFVFESGLEQARKLALDTLYVPPLRTLEPELARYLREFRGKVLFYRTRPEGFTGGEVIGPERFPMPAGGGDVRVASRNAGRILVQQRKAGNATVVFLVNVSAERTEAEVAFPAAGRAELWDATSGEIRPAASAMKRVFEPGEGVFVVVRPGAAHSPAPAHAATSSIELTGPWDFRTERENSLRLKGWKQAAGKWETAVEIEHLPSRLELSLSQDLVERIWVNGQLLRWENAGSSYLDDHNREADITSLARRGRNTFTVEAACGGEFPYLYYGYLLGDFGVRGGRVVAPAHSVAGGWTKAGYPEYSGTGIFSKTIDGRNGRVQLEIGNVAMDAVEVYVNGQPAGTRAWEPYVFDLTGKLKPGANRLEIRVTNSVANLMFGPIAAGLLGPVRLRIEGGGQK